MINNPCEYVRTHFSSVMSKMIDETEQDGREHGFYVYRKDGVVKRTNIQVGGKTSILIKANFGSVPLLGPPVTPIATAHTHPYEDFDYLFSQADLNSMINSGIQFAFIGYRRNGIKHVEVFAPKGYTSYSELVQSVLNDLHLTSTNGKLTKEQYINFVKKANDELRLCKLQV